MNDSTASKSFCQLCGKEYDGNYHVCTANAPVAQIHYHNSGWPQYFDNAILERIAVALEKIAEKMCEK